MATKTKTVRTRVATSPSALEFKPNLPPRRGAREFDFPADELKKHKNQWAVVKLVEEGSAGGQASYIRKQLEEREIEGFEVHARGSEVWARFVGK